MRRILIGITVIFGALIIAIAVKFGPTVYRLKVGLKQYETVPPMVPASLGDKAVLVFSKTNGYRDDDQIKAANIALAGIAKLQGWSFYFTENAAVFNPVQLGRFKAVVWNNVSGDVLTEQQRQTFKSWMEQGGGYVGLHGSGGDDKYAWKWYVDDLIGAQFIGHTLGPQIQRATLIIDDVNHPATKDLGPSWVRSDEWYSFAASPRAKGYHVLVSIDESTYQPTMKLPFGEPRDVRMGNDHPLVWWHCVGAGRALYSALGHTPSSYAEVKYLQFITGAISWAAGFEPSDCVAGAD